MKIKIGSVPYLNARPLVNFFATTEGQSTQIEVVEAVPSKLARMLEEGEIAVALVSSIELVRQPEWGYVPHIGICSNGPVESVKLFYRETTPFNRIQSVALDASSLTSVMLLKILLEEYNKKMPTYQTHQPDLVTMLAHCDAALLIGDLGYKDYGTQIATFDLGEAWTNETALPFVWATWIGPKENLTPALSAALHRAKQWGLENLDEIIATEAARHGESTERARHYLTQVMQFTLTPAATQGLELFLEKGKARQHFVTGT
jgi:chorismate dehydratase